MQFARAVFRLAGIYGLLTIVPMYGLEGQVSREVALTQPIFYYGFLGCALAWQIAFLLMSRDPRRYRPLIPAAIVEKFAYVLAVAVLWYGGRVHPSVLPFAAIDAVWGILFVLSYRWVD